MVEALPQVEDGQSDTVVDASATLKGSGNYSTEDDGEGESSQRIAEPSESCRHAEPSGSFQQPSSAVYIKFRPTQDRIDTAADPGVAQISPAMRQQLSSPPP